MNEETWASSGAGGGFLPLLEGLIAGFLLGGCGACSFHPADAPVGPSPVACAAETGGIALDREMAVIQGWYRLLFGFTGKPPRPVRVRVGRRSGTAESDLYPACYRPEEALILFHRPPNRMLLLHELAHHYLHQLVAAPPLWLEEGVATYLGWSAMDDRHLVPGEIPVVHYRALRACLNDGPFRSPARLAGLSPRDFYDPEAVRCNYALSWGMVYYLFRVRFPRRLSFRAKVERAARLDRTDLVAMDEPFHAFWRDFSVSRMLEERLAGGDELRRLSSAFRLGLLQDPGSFPILLERALDTSEPERFRRVCLLAAAVTAEAERDGRLRETLLRALGRMDGRGPLEPGRTARALETLLRKDSGTAVVEWFQEMGKNSDFYPGDRILAVECLHGEHRFGVPSLGGTVRGSEPEDKGEGLSGRDHDLPRLAGKGTIGL